MENIKIEIEQAVLLMGDTANRDGFVRTAKDHVTALMTDTVANPETLLVSLNVLTRAELKKIEDATNPQDKNTLQKYRSIRNTLYKNDMTNMDKVRKASNAMEKIMELSTKYLIAAKYANDDGSIAWSQFKKYMEEKIRQYDEANGRQKERDEATAEETTDGS